MLIHDFQQAELSAKLFVAYFFARMLVFGSKISFVLLKQSSYMSVNLLDWFVNVRKKSSTPATTFDCASARRGLGECNTSLIGNKLIWWKKEIRGKKSWQAK